MSLPADLPGQIAHVFPASAQRDVLINLARAVEELKQLAVSPPKNPSAGLHVASLTYESPYPIKEGGDVSTGSER